MTLSRRDFLSSTCMSATGLASVGAMTGCSTKRELKTEINNDQIAQILGDYLAVGPGHEDLVTGFIEDLRTSANSTEGPEETARILGGERGQGEAERYVIQEFIRFSNYRMWIRRADQTLGPALDDELRDA